MFVVITKKKDSPPEGRSKQVQITLIYPPHPWCELWVHLCPSFFFLNEPSTIILIFVQPSFLF